MKINFDLPIISTNKFYSGIHWSTRKKIVDQYHFYIFYLFKGKEKAPIPCKIEFGFSNNLDTDNNSAMCKIIIDGLRLCGIIKDDTTKYIKEITIKATDENYIEIKEL